MALHIGFFRLGLKGDKAEIRVKLDVLGRVSPGLFQVWRGEHRFAKASHAVVVTDCVPGEMVPPLTPVVADD